MSIFGRGYPWTDNSKQGLLDINDIPSNMKLKGITDYKNVLSRAHLKMILQDVKSELSLIISAILGIDISNIILFDDGKNIRQYINGESVYNSGLKIFINIEDLRMYLSLGLDTYLYPFSLATEAMNHLRKTERESVYYCKFDETPVGKTIPIRDTQKTISQNGWSSQYGIMMFTNNLENAKNIRTPEFVGRPTQHKDLFVNSKDLLRNTSLGYGFMRTIESNFKNCVYDNIAIPNVKANEWRIPIYTDQLLNAQMYIENLDVQIDFMTNPFKHLNESNIDYISGDKIQLDRGRVYSRHRFRLTGLVGKEYLDNTGTVLETDTWMKNTYHTGGQIDNTLYKNTEEYEAQYESTARIQEFELNKRPDRHMRYHISAATCFRTNDENIRLADYLEVNKIYDTEASIPMSSGMTGHFSVYGDTPGVYTACPRAEGIHPDPEDLTNPMDLSVDFEFRKCNNDKSHNREINGKPCSLLGYLIIRGYSGLVGSTLLNGSFDVSNQKSNTSNEKVATAYSNATRPHDTFFKVTIRTPKGITTVGGNFFEPGASFDTEVQPYYKKECKIEGNVFSIPTANYLNPFDETGLEGVSGGLYPNIDIDSAGAKDYPYDYSDKKGYHVSPELQWGTSNFYKYRIKDKGGFLRMPIRDYIWIYNTWNHRNLFTKSKGFSYWSGYVHPVTALLDYFFWSNKDGRNIGGYYMSKTKA